MSIFVELPRENYNDCAFDNFQPAADFNLGSARALMWASQLAYETQRPEKMEAIYPGWGFTGVKPFYKTIDALRTAVDTRGFIGKRPDATIVAFAGTDPAVLENIITDASVIPQPGTDTHGGFTTALDAVWDVVGPAVAAATQPVIFAGHSLGAALAVLASQRAATAGQAPLATYTYGMPRAGGRSFATQYDAALGAATYRLVHGNDIVPTVPMSGLGFRHVGRLLRCASGGKFAGAALSDVGSDQPNFSQGLLNGIGDEIWRLLRLEASPSGPGPIGPLLSLLPAQIRDHLPDRYLAALSA
jgi:triacylglycerol lipase